MHPNAAIRPMRGAPDRPETVAARAPADQAQARRRLAVLAAGCIAAALGLGAPARAESGRLMPASVPPAYTQECAGCHLAYPPGLLPAASWGRIMGSLDTHYGSDASLDAATVQQLSAWLRAHAGTYKRVAEPPPEDRITRSAWFVRKHRGIEPATWQLPAVKRASNCAACHGGAERGQFSEQALRLPAGLSDSQRRRWGD